MKEKLDKSEIENIAALTPLQEGILFHYLRDPESEQYFEQLSLAIRGDIDIIHFKKAWNHVIQFNETLRSAFRWQELEKPVQVFLKKHELEIATYDFSGKSPQDQERLIEDVRIKDRKIKFDLTQVPFRILLCKIQPDRYEMIISIHHIICDGWSTGIIMKEFLEFYGDFKNNSQPVKPTKKKFIEFVKWLQAQDTGKQKKFWKDYLDGFSVKTELPIKNRKKMGIYAKKAETYSINTGIPLKSKLESYSKHQKVTLSSIIYAAWGLLLQRYINDNDVIFGTTVSGRAAKIKGLDKMVGLFINTLPLRIKANADESIDQVVKKINGMLPKREESGYISLAAINDYAKLENKDELFDSILVVDNYPLDKLFWQNSSGLSIDNYSIFEMSHYDLTISVMLSDDMEIRFIFGKDVFEKEAVISLSSHYLRVLESIADNPGKGIFRVDVLTEKEKQLLLTDFNSTDTDYKKERTVSELFEDQAAAVPDNIAVVCNDEMISYKELDRKSNQLAGLLIREGVRNNDIVGLIIKRSIDLIIGIIGILKVNAICLPIAVTYPGKRKNGLLQDSGAGFVLKQKEANYHLDVSVKVIDQEYPGNGPGDSTSFPLKLKPPNDAAFVFYTSGSTGRPKGIIITQSGTINNIYSKIKAMDLSRQDIFCQCLNISFAASVWQIFTPLILGSTFYIYPGDILIDSYELFRRVEAHCVTVIEVVPSMLNSYLQLSGEKISLPLHPLRGLLLTGEKVESSLVNRFFKNYNIRLVNAYGQTEYTDDALYYEIPYNLETEIVPIGKPALNTQVYILNRYYCLQPLGIPGELFVAGDGLAKGYLNDPEATHERFIQNPFNINEKMYITGDLARWLLDGNIQFLGRQDHQVKIRGFRIELGEIENHILRCPGIKEAAVLTRERKAGEKSLCAFVISESSKEKEITTAEIRRFLIKVLPDYMIPGHFVLIEKLPKTSSGKIDRIELAKMEIKKSIAASSKYIAPSSQFETRIQEIWLQLLDKEKEQISINDHFFDLGGHSLLMIKLKSKLEKTFGHEIKIIELFNYPTIAHQARLIEERLKQGKEEYKDKVETEMKVISKPGVQPGNQDIAVIGISLRVPGAADINEFWKNLINGTECISFFEENELDGSESYNVLKSRSRLIPAGSVLGDVDLFDADFFGINPGEAEIMDPQHRLFLEYTWRGLEDAGYVGETYSGSIGVYAGVGWNIYLLNNVLANPEMIKARGELHTMIANDKDFLASRVAYKLNLKGPALAVQTACSTSLVAVHLARQGLLCGDCDMALAGGVAVKVPEKTGYIYTEGGHLSPDGHCKPFDAQAKGTVFGNGIGIVVLKRWADAIKNKDHIYAVIKSSAINNDGSLKVGYTSPSEMGQSEVILKALHESGVHPHTIGYVETHGTGTVLGDPVEISALIRAFRIGSTGTGIEKEKKQYCSVGSVKANIGHLDTAAGIVGFIKTVLCLKYKQIPASINFERPNPLIDFANSPFHVNRTLRDWPDNDNEPGTPRRASVSSFGIGGTNAHVVLEEAPGIEASSEGRRHKLILLSAKTTPALDRNTFNLVQHLKKNPAINLANAAYTLQVGRGSFKHRRMVLGETTQEIINILSNPNGNPLVSTSVCEENDKHIIFMFPGQGSQYVNMGLGLYKTETVFREEMNRCFEILSPIIGYDIKEILYPGISLSEVSEESSNLIETPLIGSPRRGVNQTEIAQPVIFIFEYALAKLLMTWGIKPHAMIGHSIGEYTAACLAGVFSLEDALELVTWRGKLMQQMPSGAMLSVPLPEEELEPLLKSFPDVSLAAVNSSCLCVVSGLHEAVEAFSRELTRSKGAVTVTQLHTSHAFHSPMMDAMLTPFAEKARGITLKPPQLPYISNLTGKWITIEKATEPSYWVRHILKPVRFNEGLTELLEDSKAVFAEIGPGRALSTFVRKHQSYKNHLSVLNLVRHPRDDIDDAYFLQQQLGHLWLSGVIVDWEGFYQDEQRHRLPMPTYSFDHLYYWKSGLKRQAEQTKDKKAEKAPVPIVSLEEEKKKETVKQNPLKDWFYVPTWKRSQKLPPYHPSEIAAHSWLVFMDSSGWGEGLISRIKKEGGHVCVVKPGSQFAKLAEGIYSLNPHHSSEYENLLKSLNAEKKVPPRIVHLWNVLGEDGGAAAPQPLTFDSLDHFLDRGFYSLIYLAQAVGKLGITDELFVIVVTDNMQTVTPGEINRRITVPLRSTVLGACKVIPKEYPNLHCRSIDIVLPPSGSQQDRMLLDRLLGEFIKEEREKPLEPVAAYRSGFRWVQAFEPVFLEPPQETAQQLNPKGVYLITGGLGGMGLVLAQYLAARVQARLILTDLFPFPSPAEYDQWLADHGEQDTISQQIGTLKKLETLGAEVTVAQADAADYSRMKAVIKDAVYRYGSINGIIHTAGVPDGGVIQAKTREAVEVVMTPKIKGTLVLDAVLSEMAGDFTPDFFILCSSINAVLGAFGQVAYTAANVFLDYFSQHKNSRTRTSGTTGTTGTWVVSINWDTWQEVGMAVKAESQLQCHEVAHPLFHRWVKKKTDEIVFTSTFRVKDFWVLDEHRLLGKPVLPGTAYLEMARAAFEHYTGNTAVEIRETYFLAPLVMEENHEREVRTILKKQEDTARKEFSFSIISRMGVSAFQWQEHARGKMIPPEPRESQEAPGYNPGQLMAECHEDDAAIIDISHFGPRWSNIKKVKYGKGRRVAVLELDAVFAPEVSTYKLHPALLDMAVSFLDERIKQGNSYVPFSYNGIKIYHPLPHRLLTWVRLHENQSLSNEMLEFEVLIMDEEGSVCVEIESFMLKRVKGEESVAQPGLSGDTRNFCLEMPAASTGNLDTLELKPGLRKKPGPGEVEIEVYAAGLNFKEVLLALGMLPPPDQTISFGLECSGRICGLGEGVKEFQVGDEVIAFAFPAFSRFLLTPASAVAHKPGHLSFEEAGALPIAFLTAYYSLITLGRLQEEERVLIHSAAGGVGLAAVKIAQWKGAEIFATAGNPEKREYLSSLGIKHVMDSRSLDFADKVMTVTEGKGVDVLLNSLAGEFISKGLSIMAPYGRFLEIGVRDIFNNSQLGMRAFEKGISFFAISASKDIPGFTSIFREITAHIENRDFGPLPYRVFPMDNAADAFQYMCQAKHIGKIVVTHPDRLERHAHELLLGEGLPSKGIRPAEGMEVVDRILDQVPMHPEQQFSQVAVSTTDLPARIRKNYYTRMPGAGTSLEVVRTFGTKGAVNPRPPLSTDYVPPGTEMEKQVARIWLEFLGLEKVGIHDNFFELGASSLDIIQVNNKLNQILEKELSVVTFYTYPTIHALVEHLSGQKERSSEEFELRKSKSTLKRTIKTIKKL